MEVILCIAVALILIVGKMWYDKIMYAKRLRARLQMQWGAPDGSEYFPEKMDNIASYYRETGAGDVDDITWNDLEMDRIYQQINHTQSSMGQEYLYALLRKPLQSEDELEERERLICFFTEQEEQRMEIQIQLSRIGKMGKFSVYSYLSRVKDLKNEKSLGHILQMLAFFVSVGLCFVWPSVMVAVAVGVAIANMITYYQRKAEMEKFYQLFAYIVNMVDFAEKISKIPVPELGHYLERLGTIAGEFDRFCRWSGLVVGGAKMSGDMADAVMDYIRLLTHIDIIKFQSMSREAARLEDDLIEMFEVIGYLDSMISIASYRVMMEKTAVPELLMPRSGMSGGTKDGSSDFVLEAEALYHPLIEEPVKNTIVTQRSILLTGSNASGKSTFIKTVAINAILAQTIHTVLADRYRADFFRIYSSMALRDDIMSSESYYIVEIKSLKRIVDAAKEEGTPVLCFIDEVLRGTNTVERIASSSQILSMLSQMNAMCFAASHDIELASLLQENYDNYHFEERIEKDIVTFDYTLREGRAMTRNAIKLLGMIGYDDEIIQRAEESVQQFLETGIWKM